MNEIFSTPRSSPLEKPNTTEHNGTPPGVPNRQNSEQGMANEEGVADAMTIG